MSSILCVDGDSNNREPLVRLLSENGYRVLQASNVRGAVGLAQREPDLALILLDLNMPESGGFDALKVLKADMRTESIPVVVVSAGSRPEDANQAKKLGAAEVVTNAVSDAVVLDAVQRVIGPSPGKRPDV